METMEGVENNANMAVTEQLQSFQRIEMLENFGVTKQDILKLKGGGFHTVESIAHSTTRKLMDTKGISEQKATKLKDIIKGNR